MAYNLVTDLYTAHLAASATEPEIDDVCRAVAGLITAVVMPLSLSKPLKGVTAAAIAEPSKVPWAVVLPGGEGREEKLDQLRVAHWHSLDLLYLFGQPATTEPQTLSNLDYLYATTLAISANRNLDTGVHRIGVTGWDWRPVEYAGQTWSGMVLHLQAQTVYAMRAAW